MGPGRIVIPATPAFMSGDGAPALSTRGTEVRVPHRDGIARELEQDVHIRQGRPTKD